MSPFPSVFWDLLCHRVVLESDTSRPCLPLSLCHSRKGPLSPQKIRNKLQLAKPLGQVGPTFPDFILSPREQGKIHEPCCVIYLLKNFPSAIPPIWFLFSFRTLLLLHKAAFVERQPQVHYEQGGEKMHICAWEHLGQSVNFVCAGVCAVPGRKAPWASWIPQENIFTSRLWVLGREIDTPAVNISLPQRHN